MGERVSFERRFQGFAHGVLGGYAAGFVADRIDGPAEVNLRSLPPFERELELREAGGGSFELRNGDVLVLDAHPTRFELDVVEPPSLEQAEDAAHRLLHDEREHLYPGCFTCGPERRAGDGLRLFMGRIEGRDELIASAWTPHPELADGSGELPEELLWAALDCPTIWACWRSGFPVLARQRLERLAPVPAGEPSIVTAWLIERDGRKSACGAAIHDSQRRLLVRVESLLVDLPDAP